MLGKYFYLSYIRKKNIPLQRYSCDKGRVSKYGNLLLECCKRCGLFICNGRIFTDITIDILILYLYTFSLYENASLIIFSAEIS
jgi:hypothetical protein